MNTSPVLELSKLTKRFRIDRESMRGRSGSVHALDNIDLSLARGEALGLLGESGCGKSTLARAATGLMRPDAGHGAIEGVDIYDAPAAKRHAARLRAQLVFQDPFASLNPRLRIGGIVAEAALVHGHIRRDELADFVATSLQRVGIEPSAADRFPHSFSGGQRQRIGIARALAVRPDILVCDEPVSALDMSIRAQIINLFMELRDDLSLAFVFISHDLSIVRHFSDRIAVMYLGRIVETAPVDTLFARPHHPYTQALLALSPGSHRIGAVPVRMQGEIPSPLNPPSGCHFHLRCPHATAHCREQAPELRAVAPGHLTACHLDG